MTEWLYEAGIGEDRAALVEGGEIVEARIERHHVGMRLGAILSVRLTRKAGPAGLGEVTAEDGSTALIASGPGGVTEGASLLVEVVREAIPERGNPKLPLVRASDATMPQPAPTLLDRLRATGLSVRALQAHGPDALEAAGWSEVLEQAQTGLVPFGGGLLRIVLTPAMTVIDVDGTLPAAELAVRGAGAAGAAIRRFGIAGSIGIDLPTANAKAARQAAAEALDAALPLPFERTAVNGFGFLQVIRRREQSSLLELAQSNLALAQTLATLRQAEREPPGALTIDAPAAVLACLHARPSWLEELARRRGGLTQLRNPSMGSD